MRRIILPAIFFLICFSSFALAAAPTASESKLGQLEQRAAKAATTSVGEYAKKLLEAAKASITDAKVNFAAGKEKLAVRQMEFAEIQLNAADAKAAELEILEKLAVRRSELKKTDARLEKFRQGEE
ncbi:MAG: hypothetical protein A2076_13300 [Geobacteraceae bacterium GWC2_53_11]|nr:MAG: hypothetical protein A2076_13300 [Geobacteraceae bacterium GWC2_53_11]